MDPVEEAIRRAQERGVFDHLPGEGRPLDLREPPFVPPEWRLAYRMLAGSGFAPDVVEEAKALRRDQADLEQRRMRLVRRWDGWLRHRPWSIAEERHHLAERCSFLHEYEKDLRALNLRVHGCNARAPAAMQQSGIAVAILLAEAAAQLPLPESGAGQDPTAVSRG